jgi:hypothetical protein
MDAQIVIIIVLAAIIVAGGTWFFLAKLRSRRLRDRFGPEYGRAVEKLRSRDLAEAELREREKRVERFVIAPLPPDECARYRKSWNSVQGRFVDEPKNAVDEANQLIQEVMERRGYPVTDFEQSAADLSVHYPVLVENYRAAIDIAERNERGEADTEELRQALVHYRTLFRELLDGGERPVEKKESALGRAGARLGSFREKRGGLRT